MGRQVVADLHIVTSTATTTPLLEDSPSTPKMSQAIASTAKTLCLGVGGLTAVAYLALWGGQRQVFTPLSCAGVQDKLQSKLTLMEVGISFEFPSWIT